MKKHFFNTLVDYILLILSVNIGYGVYISTLAPLNVIFFIVTFVGFFLLSRKIMYTYVLTAKTKTPTDVIDVLGDFDYVILKCDDTNIKNKLEQIRNMMDTIIESTKKTKQFTNVTRYVDYYPKTIINICNDFLLINDKKQRNIKRIEVIDSLDTIVSAFEQKCIEIKKIDTFDMDVKMVALKEKLKK